MKYVSIFRIDQSKRYKGMYFGLANSEIISKFRINQTKMHFQIWIYIMD